MTNPPAALNGRDDAIARAGGDHLSEAVDIAAEALHADASRNGSTAHSFPLDECSACWERAGITVRALVEDRQPNPMPGTTLITSSRPAMIPTAYSIMTVNVTTRDDSDEIDVTCLISGTFPRTAAAYLLHDIAETMCTAPITDGTDL